MCDGGLSSFDCFINMNGMAGTSDGAVNKRGDR